MKALILAAGLGTRLRPHTLTTPKALFTLAGRPLLDFHMRNLTEAGCEAVGINTHHLPEPIETFIATRHFDIPVYLRHEPAILGTGGAIKNWADFWDHRPFMVVNADVYSTIDLRAVYAFHLRRRPDATLVLVDDPEFNTVGVDPVGRVYEFAGSKADAPAGALTFTGIQVLDPIVLDFIPGHGFHNSIDAFRAMIAAGRTVLAFVPERGAWKDLGTEARYRSTAAQASAREAWQQAFSGTLPEGAGPERIEGDGSDRQWSRWRGAGRSMILADHGLHATAGVAEVDAFVAIGRHLKSRQVPVPAIYFADTFAGLVFLEDLGDTSLQSLVQAQSDRRQVLSAYHTVIDGVIRMAIEGARGFDPAWTFQTPAYTREVILDRECRYFRDAFLVGYAGLDVDDSLSDEFNRIADGALEGDEPGFMHRDCQSRNIMVKDGRFYFIDFQGGRLGPPQYDLAALLIDPYVGLAIEEQEELLDYAMQGLSRRRPIDPRRFRRIFAHCALARNLQVLGAFGFLSMVKGKPQFAHYIPTALHSLEARLRSFQPPGFPKLQRWTELAIEKLGCPWYER
jgi:aminoglycoside/choline kinase family phosphotransferase/GTP:adenosylcobinamide-phosphate guanylyltransferase